MKIIFILSLGIFIILLVSVIIIGPHDTEDALKELVRYDNYELAYEETLPIAQIALFEDTSEQTNNFLHMQRELQDKRELSPLIVPSSGIAPKAAFLYTGKLRDGKHEGIDIWTNTKGAGMDGKTYGKGNPVYASCDGVVRRIWRENGDLFITCDELDEFYEGIVPSRTIETLYGHMGDQITKENYILVQEGDSVKQGDLLGYQGNLAYYSPQNRVVHLHFGVYDIRNGRYEAMDPTLYIGVSCTTLMQEFEAGV